ncbi:MAG: hypothetical protein H7125_03430 [Proteobacteria bacterium]|nr:hypothetical protein [Burkholderiales bacterium]
MRAFVLAFGIGIVLFPLLAVWRPTPRWMNRCWVLALACLAGLIALSVLGGDDDFNRTLSDRQAEVQKVELLEAKAFTAAFQHLLLDGQLYGVMADTEFTQGERVSVRLMRHRLFNDTRLFVCSERGCSAAQPLDED